MTSPRSVGGDARLRLFLALRLPDGVLDSIEVWQHEHLHGVRAVLRENLHITLAFLGHRPAGELEAIVGELRAAAAATGSQPLRLAPARYRETRSAAMFVLDDEGGRATEFTDDLQRRLAALGVYEREARPWLPHLTVARFRSRPGFRPSTLRTGVLIPSDAAAYLSRPHPTGARYEVVATAALGGR